MACTRPHWGTDASWQLQSCGTSLITDFCTPLAHHNQAEHQVIQKQGSCFTHQASSLPADKLGAGVSRADRLIFVWILTFAWYLFTHALQAPHSTLHVYWVSLLLHMCCMEASPALLGPHKPVHALSSHCMPSCFMLLHSGQLALVPDEHVVRHAQRHCTPPCELPLLSHATGCVACTCCFVVCLITAAGPLAVFKCGKEYACWVPPLNAGGFWWPLLISSSYQ
jgi:hypothetical protein